MQQDINKISFEDALKELEEISEKISSGQGNLDAMVEMFERGNKLKDYCREKLENAEMKIEKIIKKDTEK